MLKDLYYRPYDYKEIVEAVRQNPSEENVNELGKWCDSNLGGEYDWNGEYWTCDEFHVYPIEEEIREGVFKHVGYSLTNPY